MLKKYLILAFAVSCNIQSMSLKPDVNQQEKAEAVSCIKWLKELNRNPRATAADIQAGINLCDNTLAELTQAGTIQKTKRPFINYKLLLTQKFLVNAQNLTPLKPDTNQNDKSLVVGYLKNLRQLDVKIKNSTAAASDILAGINLCRSTLDRLQQGGTTAKNLTLFKTHHDKLCKAMNDNYRHLTLA
jgi:hypothetical protein